jgi:glycosyltransferase involved in cell wall biosynthesis
MERQPGAGDPGARPPRAIRVCIDAPDRRRDTWIRHLESVGVPAVRGSRRLRSALWQIPSADVVQRTLFEGALYPKSLAVFATARLLRRRTIRYWVGSDVWMALTDPRVRRWAHRLDRVVDINLCVAPHLCDELGSIGIRSVALPPPQDGLDTTSCRVPDHFTVLSYTGANTALYRVEEVLQVAAALPEVRFLMVGRTPTGYGSASANVIFRGEVSDMESVYAETSVLLRLVRHDGLPRMVIEALARAKPVIYSFAFPCCHPVDGVDDSCRELRRLMASYTPNHAGRKLVESCYRGRPAAQALKNVYARLMSRPRGGAART